MARKLFYRIKFLVCHTMGWQFNGLDLYGIPARNMGQSPGRRMYHEAPRGKRWVSYYFVGDGIFKRWWYAEQAFLEWEK